MKIFHFFARFFIVISIVLTVANAEAATSTQSSTNTVKPILSISGWSGQLNYYQKAQKSMADTLFYKINCGSTKYNMSVSTSGDKEANVSITCVNTPAENGVLTSMTFSLGNGGVGYICLNESSIKAYYQGVNNIDSLRFYLALRNSIKKNLYPTDPERITALVKMASAKWQSDQSFFNDLSEPSKYYKIERQNVDNYYEWRIVQVAPPAIRLAINTLEAGAQKYLGSDYVLSYQQTTSDNPDRFTIKVNNKNGEKGTANDKIYSFSFDIVKRSDGIFDVDPDRINIAVAGQSYKVTDVVTLAMPKVDARLLYQGLRQTVSSWTDAAIEVAKAEVRSTAVDGSLRVTLLNGDTRIIYKDSKGEAAVSAVIPKPIDNYLRGLEKSVQDDITRWNASGQSYTKFKFLYLVGAQEISTGKFRISVTSNLYSQGAPYAELTDFVQVSFEMNADGTAKEGTFTGNYAKQSVNMNAVAKWLNYDILEMVSRRIVSSDDPNVWYCNGNRIRMDKLGNIRECPNDKLSLIADELRDMLGSAYAVDVYGETKQGFTTTDLIACATKARVSFSNISITNKDPKFGTVPALHLYIVGIDELCQGKPVTLANSINFTGKIRGSIKGYSEWVGNDVVENLFMKLLHKADPSNILSTKAVKSALYDLVNMEIISFDYQQTFSGGTQNDWWKYIHLKIAGAAYVVTGSRLELDTRPKSVIDYETVLTYVMRSLSGTFDGFECNVYVYKITNPNEGTNFIVPEGYEGYRVKVTNQMILENGEKIVPKGYFKKMQFDIIVSKADGSMPGQEPANIEVRYSSEALTSDNIDLGFMAIGEGGRAYFQGLCDFAGILKNVSPFKLIKTVKVQGIYDMTTRAYFEYVSKPYVIRRDKVEKPGEPVQYIGKCYSANGAEMIADRLKDEFGPYASVTLSGEKLTIQADRKYQISGQYWVSISKVECQVVPTGQGFGYEIKNMQFFDYDGTPMKFGNKVISIEQAVNIYKGLSLIETKNEIRCAFVELLRIDLFGYDTKNNRFLLGLRTQLSKSMDKYLFYNTSTGALSYIRNPSATDVTGLAMY